MLARTSTWAILGIGCIACGGFAAQLPDPVASEGGDASSLRAAVEWLSAAYGPRYPRAAEFLARLATVSSNAGPAVSEVRKAVCILESGACAAIVASTERARAGILRPP